MSGTVIETFFLPDETGRHEWTVPSDIYNLSRTLLSRSEQSCVFVPIRSMQYLAVITDHETVFVDSQAYACNEDEGGRLIMLVWKYSSTTDREALNKPAPCEVVYHHPESQQIQSRLVGDFKAALQQLDQRYRNRSLPADGARIIKLK